MSDHTIYYSVSRFSKNVINFFLFEEQELIRHDLIPFFQMLTISQLFPTFSLLLIFYQ